MRWLRFLLFLLGLGLAASCYAGTEDWLPITPQDLAFKDVPGSPGAPAVMLYYRHDIDDNSQSEFVYARIKVLSAKGQGYADVEVPLVNIIVDLADLKARTIRPDGSTVDFTGKVFEKTIFKGRGVKLFAKTFTMPEVAPGSIIEYKYRLVYRKELVWAGFFTEGRWVLQHDLYTVKEDFTFKPYTGGVFQSSGSLNFMWDGATVSYVSLNMKDKPKNNGGNIEYSAQNVPGFESEAFMPPEDNFKPSVRFFYLPKGEPSTEKLWREIGEGENTIEQRFVAGDHGVKEAALKAIGTETDTELKLRLLYARAQEIRNLSYERPRSREERQKENLKPNEYVSDVLAHGYGHRDEITLLFIAMARAAGFEASSVHASNRREMFFSRELLSMRQLEGDLAAVHLNSADVYLEPGTRYCPFGVLSWTYTATDALKLDKKGGSFIKIPPAGAESSTTQRIASLKLGQDGALTGTINVQFKGQEALERRLSAIDHDEAGRRKALEDEMKEWLPAGTTVQVAAVQGWEAEDEPLAVQFTVQVPAYASATGKRLLMPAYVFKTTESAAFSAIERKYPVYFAHAFAERDDITIQFPPGVSVEILPHQQEAKLPYARYASLTKSDGQSVNIRRVLLFNGIYFDATKYPELKDFFGKVHLGDEEQVVLHEGQVSAQKEN